MGLYLKISALVSEYNSATTGFVDYQEFNRKLIKIVIDYIIERG